MVERAHQSADLVVKASGVGVYDQELERLVLDLRLPDGLVAFWDVDAPATLDRVHHDADDPFRALVPRYDLVLTYGGGDPVVNAYRDLGARCCVPIYNALDPDTHHPVAPDARFAGDLGFLGNRLPDRETRVEQFFLHAAAQLPDHRFLLGGNGWHDKPMPPNVRNLGHVYTHDHNAFNVSARMVLNINRESMARYGFSPPTRVFEAAGAGACLVTDHWEGIEQFLAPGEECSWQQTATKSPIMFAVRRRSGRARSALRLCGACRPSTPTRIGQKSSSAYLGSWKRKAAVRAMRLVVLGLTITSSWGNGHATTYRALLRELAARGHDVLFLERDKPWYAQHRDLPCPPYGRTELYDSLDDLRRRFHGRGARRRSGDRWLVRARGRGRGPVGARHGAKRPGCLLRH
jgi:spore maturation protein CgeB